MPDTDPDIPCLYFSAKSDGVIYEANASLCQALGYARDELVGQKLESIFSLATRIFQQTHFYPLLELKGYAEEIYITLRAKSGDDIPALINAERKEQGGEFYLQFAGVALNKRKKFEEEIIAAKKAAEKSLQENIALKTAQRELQQRAEELDRQVMQVNLQNQELKQFGHIATHTLEEPLRKLLFFSNEILGNKGAAGSKASAEKITKTAQDLHLKVQGLQKYTWLASEEMEWEQVDTAKIIEEARQQLVQEDPGNMLIVEVENLPAIEADSRQLLYLFKELLSNAIRFHKPGSTTHVKINGSNVLLNEFRQLNEKYKYTDWLRLQVADDGIGFDDTYQQQAFELFRTLHPVSGQGLGLALCKKIVDNHGGSIALESRKNIGTTAIIFLPVKQKRTSL